MGEVKVMLQQIHENPKDKKIAGIHSIPITDDGSVMMVWNKDEQLLTTIGGRLEEGESIDNALDRETIEEAGIILDRNRLPIASWYWENTDTYTVYVVARVSKYVPMPEGFETTGRVVMNFETARQMIYKLEGESGDRIKILDFAERAYKKLIMGENNEKAI
jgi:8-oxo-dGTP diphosphatase